MRKIVRTRFFLLFGVVGQARRGRRIQMLHNWANDGGFVILKRAAEDRELWRHRERMSKNLLYSRGLLTMIMNVLETLHSQWLK